MCAGVNNAFLVNAKDPLATTYNDSSGEALPAFLPGCPPACSSACLLTTMLLNRCFMLQW
jgi:hypothetical protein